MCKTYDPAAKKVITGAPVETVRETAQYQFKKSVAASTGAPETLVERALRGDKFEGAESIRKRAEQLAARQARFAARAAGQYDRLNVAS